MTSPTGLSSCTTYSSRFKSCSPGYRKSKLYLRWQRRQRRGGGSAAKTTGAGRRARATGQSQPAEEAHKNSPGGSEPEGACLPLCGRVGRQTMPRQDAAGGPATVRQRPARRGCKPPAASDSAQYCPHANVVEPCMSLSQQGDLVVTVRWSLLRRAQLVWPQSLGSKRPR